MKSKSEEIEKAKQELILLYLGIKIRKESDVINYYNNNKSIIGIIFDRKRIHK